jgi:hypothetical protein
MLKDLWRQIQLPYVSDKKGLETFLKAFKKQKPRVAIESTRGIVQLKFSANQPDGRF